MSKHVVYGKDIKETIISNSTEVITDTALAVGIETPCWEWQGNISDQGYGRITRNYKNMLAHRASYIAHNGDIPAESVVRHLCHNKACVNPAHLALGTQQENMQDSARNPNYSCKRKLTDEDLLSICMSMDTYKVLAARFGVLVRQIGKIKTRFMAVREYRGTWPIGNEDDLDLFLERYRRGMYPSLTLQEIQP
jgi:hypothetical protein